MNLHEINRKIKMKKVSSIARQTAMSVLLFLIAATAYSQETLDGKWEGKIVIMGTELEMAVNFKTDPDSIRGTIDIITQGAKDLPLIHISHSAPKVYFELPAGQTLAVFDGSMNADSISGRFTQAGAEGTFVLRKATGKPEEVKKELPYREEEVTFTNGANSFAGTLTIPFGEGKFPAIVMITGSGAQDRNETIVGFKIFGVIADHFTRNGIAVLRYDDRGIGGSKGKGVDSSTTEDFAYDVIEAVEYLKTRNDIDAGKIGLCGHSEGGIVAPLAASKYDGIDFIILIAGTGVPGKEILLEQSKLIMEANKTPKEDIESALNTQKKVYDALGSDSAESKIYAIVKEQIADEYDKLPKDSMKTISKDGYIEKNLETAKVQLRSVLSPWFKFFVSYDPSRSLEKVKCPVLMLFGEKDLQVPPAQNKAPMEQALTLGGNTKFKTVVFPDANHLFQRAETGSPTEYAKLPKEFVPGFLETMSEWITQMTK
jgi:pimeloyl-ACP methyl ester carboxylesterase